MANHLHNSMAILRPRVTEKASLVNSANVYTFEIAETATKKDVSREIRDVYKVNPIAVNIARTPRKTVTQKGIKGRTKGVKKAYVYLKAGDRIEI